MDLFEVGYTVSQMALSDTVSWRAEFFEGYLDFLGLQCQSNEFD